VDGQYVNGDPNGSDRRVVLDSTFKDKVKEVLIFQRKGLLERFDGNLPNEYHAPQRRETKYHRAVNSTAQESIIGYALANRQRFTKFN
jgi:hypothetical protein